MERAPRYSPVCIALLLVFGECGPAWSQALQHAAVVAPGVSAGALGPVRLDLPSNIIAFPSVPQQLTNAALPGVSLPAPRASSVRGVRAAALREAPLPKGAVRTEVQASAKLISFQAPAAKTPLPEKISALQKGVAQDAQGLAEAEGESAGTAASRSFDRLTGTREIAADALAEGPIPSAETLGGQRVSLASSQGQAASAPAAAVPAPSAKPDAQTQRDARLAFTGTAVFKVGMEALNIVVPLIALTYFGSAVWMATFGVVWGASMTISSLLAGGLIDRKPLNKVISGAMLLQALSVSATIALLLSGPVSPLILLPLHALSGAAMGVITTARDCLPARLLGRDHVVLGKFNAKTHLIYETAGTIAPILVGLLMRKFGLVSALFLHPPAYLLAAFFFYKLKLGSAPPSSGEKTPSGGILALLKQTASDIREGARVINSSKEFRWLGFMILAPMIVHRVVEQIMVPVFTKTILGVAEKSAWIVSASNFGELLGAALLLKALSSALRQKTKPSRYGWIPLMAAGTLATWSLSLPGGLLTVLPLIFLMSLTWAANDLSVSSYFQSRLPDASAGKALGFLMAAELGLIMAVSYLMGFMFDYLPTQAAFLAVNVLLTGLAFLFWRGQKKLRQASPRP